MGQYYRGVVLEQPINETNEIKVKKAFCCYAFDNGAKLMEHSYVGNNYVKAYEHILANECYGFPFVWCGDYADEVNNKDIYTLTCNYIDEQTVINAQEQGYIPNPNPNKHWGAEFCHEEDETLTKSYKDFSPYINVNEDYKYIVNFDKKQYIAIPEYEPNKWTIHPLPLLCASGNGRGGGDYDGTNMKMVGAWAFDRIGVTNELPTDMEEIKLTFEEC